jgi:hypothetical protein
LLASSLALTSFALAAGPAKICTKNRSLACGSLAAESLVQSLDRWGVSSPVFKCVSTAKRLVEIIP